MARMLISVTLATLSLMFATGCSTDAKKKAEAPEEKSVASFGSKYTAIEFERGKSSLTAASKRHLRDIAKAWDNEPTQELKVLAWADQEYPDKVEGKASKREVILANERARAVKDFIEREIDVRGEVDSFNMAKRPDLFSKLLKDEEYKLKESFEATGATGVKLDDGTVSYSKAGKAIVIIEQ